MKFFLLYSFGFSLTKQFPFRCFIYASLLLSNFDGAIKHHLYSEMRAGTRKETSRQPVFTTFLHFCLLHPLIKVVLESFVSSFSVEKSFLVQHNSIISSPLRTNLTRGERARAQHRPQSQSPNVPE